MLHREYGIQFNSVMIPKVVQFLETLEKLEVIDNIIKLLVAWKDISYTISITKE